MKKITALFIAAAVMLGGVTACRNGGTNTTPVPEPGPGFPTETFDFTDEVTMRQVGLTELEVTDFLGLVNAWYPVGDEVMQTVATYGVIPAATSSIEFNPEALAALEALFAEAKSEGHTGFYLASGMRDYAAQAAIYENADDKSFVQPPGHSEHQTGLAADISELSVDIATFDRSNGGRWFTQNAHRYGFVLRYPADKTNITGISYEPWHFRYVGQPHAAYMTQNKLVLEEYLDLLQTEGGYDYSFEGVDYRVMYNAAPVGSAGTISVPADYDYEVSRDNTGGYVVTIKFA